MPDIFDRLRLNPAQLRTVAERRYADAECLRKTGDNERANGAMYLGGFVIECLLKAKLLEKHPWLRAPLQPGASADEQRLWSLCYRSHDLEEILSRLPELVDELRQRDRTEWKGPSLVQTLKTICESWTIFARYSPRSETMATASHFLDQVRDLKQCLK